MADGQPWEDFEPAPRDLMITLLGAFADPRRTREVWSGGLVTLLADFGFSAGAARVALARMVRSGLLARVRRGRLASYTLTPRLIAVLEEGDRRIFSLGTSEADDCTQWTILCQTIPDERRLARERLVRRLRFLGFGPLRDGTWIAPRDREAEVVALLDQLGVREHAGLLIGQPAASLDFGAVAGRVWDLDDLAARYRAFVTRFSGYTTADGRAGLDDRTVLLLRTALVHTFRRFPVLDPELPAGLCPPPDGRADAVRLFGDLYAALSPAAQRYFDGITAPPGGTP